MRKSKISFTAALIAAFLKLCVVQSWTAVPVSVTRHASRSACSALSAGFGTSSSSGNNTKKQDGKTATPLKPKQQWDRYLALKQAPRVLVGVQIQGTDEWLPVGSVKAKDANALEAAVLRQRALIADHAKRLFPLQVTSKTKLSWGMKMQSSDDSSDGSWKTLDPKATMPSELNDKEIGFEGQPDAASGFYCVYDQGKILNASGGGIGADGRPASSKKK